MIILMVRMIILMGQNDGFPTPPHPTPNGVFGNLLSVPSYWAFPITGRSHGLAAAAPGLGQVALGAKKVPRTWTGAGPGPGGPRPSVPLFAPSATWPRPGAAAARPWERPVKGNAQ